MPLKLFKVFAVLRIPVSVFVMMGLMLGVNRGPNTGFGVVVYVGLLVLLGVTTGKMFKLKPDALGFAVAMVILETVGAFLMGTLPELERGAGMDAVFVAQAGGLVALAWAAPNAAVLWWAKRRIFLANLETRPLPGGTVRETNRLPK